MSQDTHPVPIEDVSRADRRRAERDQPGRKAEAVTPAFWKAVHSPVAHLGSKQFRKLLKRVSDGEVLKFHGKAKAILREAEAARASGDLKTSEDRKRLAEQIELAEAELKNRGVEVPTSDEPEL
ncbi:MAG: hypothetical protein V4819_19280 [Verrucomicrobiota bacterium]